MSSVIPESLHWLQNWIYLQHAWFYLNIHLSVAHVRVCPGVAEEDGHHFLLDGTLPEEINAWKSAHDILPNDRLKLLIAEELVPRAGVVLAERVVFGGETWGHQVPCQQARVVLPLSVKHRGPGIGVRRQQPQQKSPADATETGRTHAANESAPTQLTQVIVASVST